MSLKYRGGKRENVSNNKPLGDTGSACCPLGLEGKGGEPGLTPLWLEEGWHDAKRVIRWFDFAYLALGQLHRLGWQRLVGDVRQQVGDDVEAHPFLVLGVGHEPGGPGGVGGDEHGIPRPGVVIPAIEGLDVHGGELPDLAAIVDAITQPPLLLLWGHLQPVLQQNDARVHQGFFHHWGASQEFVARLLAAKTHDALHPGPVVPAAIEDDDLPRRRQMGDVALEVELALLPLRGGGQCDDPKDPGADPLGDRLDGAPLAGPVAPLEDDADLEPLVHHPLLQPDQLHVQEAQRLFVCLVAKGLLRLGHDRFFRSGFSFAAHDVLLCVSANGGPSCRTAPFKGR